MPARFSRYVGVGAVPGYQGRISDLKRVHLPELLGLRGVAIMIIVCGHLLQRVERFYGDASLTPFEKGFFDVLATPHTGCLLLFCISGYTLLVSLNNRSHSSDRNYLVTIIRNRLVRLWPPYFVVLTVTFLFLWATGYKPIGTYQFDVPPESLTASFLASCIFLHDILFDTFPRLFPPGWFLEVQVQFTIIGTVCWLWYLKISAGKSRLLIGLLLLIPISVASCLFEQFGSRGLKYSLVAYMPYFWTGALLADFRMHGESRHIDRALRSCWLAGWSGLAAFILLGGPFGNVLLQMLAHVACLGVMIRASFVPSSAFQRALVGRWLARIGVASYSIYLVHLQVLQIIMPAIVDSIRELPFPLLVAICVIFGLSIVIIVSLPFYWLIERPWVAIARRLSLNATTSEVHARKQELAAN